MLNQTPREGIRSAHLYGFSPFPVRIWTHTGPTSMRRTLVHLTTTASAAFVEGERHRPARSPSYSREYAPFYDTASSPAQRSFIQYSVCKHLTIQYLCQI